MDDTATVRMLPCKRARHIKKMTAFDLYLHFPRHIVAPTDDNRKYPTDLDYGNLERGHANGWHPLMVRSAICLIMTAPRGRYNRIITC